MIFCVFYIAVSDVVLLSVIHFQEINTRDEEGWSPMCYAALSGDPVILEALMLRGGNPNDKTSKPTPQLFMASCLQFFSVFICRRGPGYCL